MSNAFSVATNIANVLDISVRCAKHTYKLIQDLRYAPEELLALSNEVSSLELVLREVAKVYDDTRNIGDPQKSQNMLLLHLDGAWTKLTELDALIASLNCTLSFGSSSGSMTVDRCGWLKSVATVKKLQHGFREDRQNILLLLNTDIV